MAETNSIYDYETIKNHLCQNTYDKLNYEIVDNIKIYTGTTNYSKKKLDSNIKKYEKLTLPSQKIFTPLAPSTLTAKGSFSGINFNEEDIIDMLTTPICGYILKICCNYGEIINPSPDYTPPPVRERISNRGRKPKLKTKSKRKLQGSGKYFSSQITFEIYNPQSEKIYKIKLFRNGGFQVPGVNKPEMTDLIMPIKILRDYLRNEFMDDTIDILYFISVMRNYICRLTDVNMLIRLNELETLFKMHKDTDDNNPVYDLIDELPSCLNFICKDEIREYIGKKNNIIGIAEIQNNCERYFGLILKFYRPVSWKMSKRTTIKILRSGKINIDGGNSVEEAYELYHWLENIFLEYRSAIIFDQSLPIAEDSDYEIPSDAVSIYDDDIESNTELDIECNTGVIITSSD